MSTGRRTTTKQRTAVRAAPSAPEEVAPAFHRAILKIALELKKPTAKSYDVVVEETIRSMRLDPAKFRRYLGANGAAGMGLLLAAARQDSKFGP